MVTLLDLGLGEFLIPIFLFILIYAILYGVLTKVQIFGENKSLNAFIAFAISALFAVTPGAMEFVAVIAPWFTVLVILAFSFLLVFMFMGIKTKQIREIATDSVVMWTIIIIGIIIVIGGLTAVYGPLLVGGPGSTGTSPGAEIHRSIFNIKVLTTVFVLIIFSFAVRLLSYETKLH
ncbi:MAG: hypothetical protein CMH63_00370 [Nanoarchaeota archaeon]|jgi:hypothetical protein|nr:hypothetical protein [Nanoarchaeota archaeon]|tara:strand:- start:5440 stop:5970 length:531 start_codon:yes stop_codon:yes gene_type:complete